MLFLAGDKHGYATIKCVADYLTVHGIAFENVGVENAEQEVPLEDMIPRVAELVRQSPEHRAIISCGTGVGVEIGANKCTGLRACLATDARIAEWSVVYDNCNVLCLPGWEMTREQIEQIADAWLGATYDGSEKRLQMMATFDSWR